MATVYRALDTRLECDVAIKVIRRDAFSKEVFDQVLKRFEREAKTLAKLNHPNIVNIIDYGEFEGSPYLVMPFIPSATLKERLGYPTPFPQAARILVPIARALDYAHNKGILHRDVKPSNILITESGEPVLTDFGIAKILENEAGQTLTGTGMGLGTPEYMPPEQGLGKEVDKRSDIYSLGVVFYELITGKKPYNADTPMAVIFKHISDPVPRPKDFVPDLPNEVEHIIFKVMAKNSHDRYPDMAHFARNLEKLAHQSQEIIQDHETWMDSRGNHTLQDQLAETHDNLEIQDLLQKKLDKKFRLPIWFVRVGMGLIVFLLMVWVALSYIIPKVENNRKQSATNQTFLAFEDQIAATNVKLTAQNLTLMNNRTSTASQWTATPKFTPTSIFTETPPATITPALGIGLTQIREKDGMLQVFVPAGTFEMGSTTGDPDEEPVHSVYLDAFWIDQTEVTNAQYALCVSEGVCIEPVLSKSITRSSYYGNIQFADYPVIYIDWNQGDVYCRWAGASLPSEAEWEKAARGTDGRKYPWGDAKADNSLLNYNINIGDTSEVGSYPDGASFYGALDMAGNVWEWAADWYDASYYGSQTDWKNPGGPSSGDYRVLRGGSWVSGNLGGRLANRYRSNPALVYSSVGFRCARSN